MAKKKIDTLRLKPEDELPDEFMLQHDNDGVFETLLHAEMAQQQKRNPYDESQNITDFTIGCYEPREVKDDVCD